MCAGLKECLWGEALFPARNPLDWPLSLRKGRRSGCCRPNLGLTRVCFWPSCFCMPPCGPWTATGWGPGGLRLQPRQVPLAAGIPSPWRSRQTMRAATERCARLPAAPASSCGALAAASGPWLVCKAVLRSSRAVMPPWPTEPLAVAPRQNCSAGSRAAGFSGIPPSPGWVLGLPWQPQLPVWGAVSQPVVLLPLVRLGMVAGGSHRAPSLSLPRSEPSSAT